MALGVGGWGGGECEEGNEISGACVCAEEADHSGRGRSRLLGRVAPPGGLLQ